ncbi:Toll-Interleukin-Resistance domain family protein, partial [Fagus crenata]
FWYDQNKKVTRSQDVIFNENVMYKDRDTQSPSNSTQSDLVFVELDDIRKSSVAQHVVESSQSEGLTPQDNTQRIDTPRSPASTPAHTPILRRSSRPHVPNRRFELLVAH